MSESQQGQEMTNSADISDFINREDRDFVSEQGCFSNSQVSQHSKFSNSQLSVMRSTNPANFSTNFQPAQLGLRLEETTIELGAAEPINQFPNDSQKNNSLNPTTYASGSLEVKSGQSNSLHGVKTMKTESIKLEEKKIDEEDPNEEEIELNAEIKTQKCSPLKETTITSLLNQAQTDDSHHRVSKFPEKSCLQPVKSRNILKETTITSLLNEAQTNDSHNKVSDSPTPKLMNGGKHSHPEYNDVSSTK